MAGQEKIETKGWEGNVIEYEFQGNLMPLEKAFTQARKLFKRYTKEIMAAEGVTKKSQLSPDAKFLEKEIEGYFKQMSKYREFTYLDKEQEADSKRIFRKLKTRTKEFGEMRTKAQHQAHREEVKEQKAQVKQKDYTSVASQFKAQTQAEQLNILMRELPSLDPKVISDINSYVEAWRKAKQEFDQGTGSAEDLATATEELNEKARDYIPTLTKMKQQQKGANTAIESSTAGVASVQGLATGGVVSKPTFAMIGEGKYNEAVVPLGNSPQFTSMKESIADSVINKQKNTSNNYNSFNGSTSQSVVLNIDGRTLGRMQLNSMNKVRRQVGVDLK